MTRCFGCSSARFGSPAFATLSRAAAKSAAARLRALGVLQTDSGWAARLAVCRGCPLWTVAGGVPHCGKPLLRQVGRPAAAGCGCPLEAKAKSPGEHCPLTPAGRPRPRRRDGDVNADGGACDCKWCAAGHARPPAATATATAAAAPATSAHSRS